MLSVDQITRNGNQFIQRLHLDAETMNTMRSERLGLLLERFSGLESMIAKIMPLSVSVGAQTVPVIGASNSTS